MYEGTIIVLVTTVNSCAAKRSTTDRRGCTRWKLRGISTVHGGLCLLHDADNFGGAESLEPQAAREPFRSLFQAFQLDLNMSTVSHVLLRQPNSHVTGKIVHVFNEGGRLVGQPSVRRFEARIVRCTAVRLAHEVSDPRHARVLLRPRT